MNFTIIGGNVKLLARTVNSFSKVGNELFLDATPDGLELKTVNSTNTAYAAALFERDFFLSYSNATGTGTPDDYCCKVSVRPLLRIFKNITKIHSCDVCLNAAQSKLVFQFRCKSEAVKTREICLLEDESINSLRLQQSFTSKIVGNNKLFSSIQIHLHNSVQEIAFDFRPDKTLVSNHVDDDQHDRSSLRSTLTIHSSSFLSYKLDQPAHLIFCYKEFKSLSLFGAFSKLNIEMSFSQPGAPLMLEMKKPGLVQVKFIMGTMMPSARPRVQRRKVTEESVTRTATADINTVNSNLSDNVSGASNAGINHPPKEIPAANEDDRSPTRLGRKTIPEMANPKNGSAEAPAAVPAANDVGRAAGGTATAHEPPKPNSAALLNTEELIFLDGLDAPTPSLDSGAGPSTRPSRPSADALLLDDDAALDLVAVEALSRRASMVPPRKRHKLVHGGQPDAADSSEAHPAETSIVPVSPEVIEERRRKRAKMRHIFRRCFEPTFDPNNGIGCSQMLAGKSDSEEDS
ncbi:cell cycle checkpoint control protein RAD9A [Anopheles bellator]|uniref:cell cycle checkpoint control protein RAD9A n=1 Tax=Anopheles bellator TaxID=139047 RepID=UPI00264A4AD9|nr:cell cycle checkpoint control protein RAD9A [Anopheles bellator]